MQFFRGLAWLFLPAEIAADRPTAETISEITRETTGPHSLSSRQWSAMNRAQNPKTPSQKIRPVSLRILNAKVFISPSMVGIISRPRNK